MLKQGMEGGGGWGHGVVFRVWILSGKTLTLRRGVVENLGPRA